MDSGYGWCQSCGALVFNSPQCHKCDGKVKPFCVDITLVKQAERIKELEGVNKKLKDLLKEEVDDGRAMIDDMGFDAWLEQALKGE